MEGKRLVREALQRKIALLSCPIAIAVVGWWLLLREPLRSWSYGHTGPQREETRTLAEMRRKRDEHKRRNIEAALRVETLVPSLSSPMTAVEKISEAARSHGLSSLTYEVAEPISRERVLALPLSIRLRGAFGGAASFLRGLEASSLQPIMRHIELQRANGQNVVTLKVDVLLVSLVHLPLSPEATKTKSYIAGNSQ